MTEQEYESLWFKLCCMYHAKTEEYDRTLTDVRSPYDPTEAYIVRPVERNLSYQYAKKARQFVLDLARRFYIPAYIVNSQMRAKRYATESWSAQKWIDTYYFLKEQGEYDLGRGLNENNLQ